LSATAANQSAGRFNARAIKFNDDGGEKKNRRAACTRRDRKKGGRTSQELVTEIVNRVHTTKLERLESKKKNAKNKTNI